MPRPSRLALVAGLLLGMATIAPIGRAQVLCQDLLPFGLLPPEGGFSFGCARQFQLKLGATLGPDGNYILLGYPACANGPCAGQTGLPLLGCAATNGYFCCLSASQMIPTIQGINVGTLVTGLNQRIASDTDTQAGICHSAYTGNGARVANVPLIQWIGADKTQAQVTGFLRLFLVGPPTGTGTATLIPVEFVADPTPARPTTWGRLKLLHQ